MADQDSRDILMSVTLKGKALALKGEVSVAIDTSDALMEGFYNPAGATTGVDANLFCRIQDFTFSVGIEDSESGTGGEAESGTKVGASENTLHGTRGTAPEKGGKGGTGGTGGKGTTGKPAGRSRQFKHFMDFGGSEADPNTGSIGYPPSLQPITVSRQMDVMSAALLKECLNCRPLKRVIIVKRKFTGSKDNYEAYLRLEFIDCLLTEVEWDDDEIIKEKVKFVYRELKTQYRPQDMAGNLGNPVPVDFKYDADSS